MFEIYKARRALSKEDRKWAKGVTEDNHLEKLIEATRTDKPERVRYIFTLFRKNYLHDRSRAAETAVTYEAPAALREILDTQPQAFKSATGEDAYFMRDLFKKAASCELPEIWDALHDHNARRLAALPDAARENTGMIISAPFLFPPEIAGIAAARDYTRGLERSLEEAAGTPLAHKTALAAMGGAVEGARSPTLKAVIARLPSLMAAEDAQDLLNRSLVRVAHKGARLKARVLLEAKADPNAYHCAALIGAAMNNHNALRDELIAAGADVRPHLKYIDFMSQEAARERLMAGGASVVEGGPGITYPVAPTLVLERLAEMAEAAEMRKAGLPVEKITLTLRRPSGPLSLTFNFATGNVTAVGAGVETKALDGMAEAGHVRRDAERIAGAALAAGLIPRPGGRG